MDLGTRAHIQFLELIGRLGELAARRDHAAFAATLRACLAEARDSQSKCPIAMALQEDGAGDGAIPSVPRGGPALPLLSEDPPVFDPARALEYITAAVEAKARVRHDARFLAALQRCRQARQSDPACPLYRALTDPPTAGEANQAKGNRAFEASDKRRHALRRVL
jgi:hypothetical protein